VNERLTEPDVVSPDALKRRVTALLTENRDLWQKLGPRSEIATVDPNSSAHTLWTLRKLDTILPNNQRILSLLDRHSHLLDAEQVAAYCEFKTHARAFAAHQDEPQDAYPLFPECFAHVFTP
ncbi:MAG: hypothetical protein H6699_11685, partial [Myxococcales bacterium]|nr:hypothetical protein [Myxococcales bacterium]